jgi:hypothetical protein
MFEPRYPGMVEMGRRTNAWVMLVFLTLPLVMFLVLAALPGESPTGFRVAIAVLALLDLIPIAVLRFPRTYLTVDAAARTATYVERGTTTTFPLADLEPLFIHQTIGAETRGEGRHGRVQWFLIRSAAAPVVFYRGADQRSAEKRLARLTQRFGFTQTAPQKQEYVR